MLHWEGIRLGSPNRWIVGYGGQYMRCSNVWHIVSGYWEHEGPQFGKQTLVPTDAGRVLQIIQTLIQRYFKVTQL